MSLYQIYAVYVVYLVSLVAQVIESILIKLFMKALRLVLLCTSYLTSVAVISDILSVLKKDKQLPIVTVPIEYGGDVSILTQIESGTLYSLRYIPFPVVRFPQDILQLPWMVNQSTGARSLLCTEQR